MDPVAIVERFAIRFHIKLHPLLHLTESPPSEQIDTDVRRTSLKAH